MTVAPITPTIRDIPTGVVLGAADGMPRDCAINMDHVQTVAKAKLGSLVATISAPKMGEVRSALLFALGFQRTWYRAGGPPAPPSLGGGASASTRSRRHPGDYRLQSSLHDHDLGSGDQPSRAGRTQTAASGHGVNNYRPPGFAFCATNRPGRGEIYDLFIDLDAKESQLSERAAAARQADPQEVRPLVHRLVEQAPDLRRECSIAFPAERPDGESPPPFTRVSLSHGESLHSVPAQPGGRRSTPEPHGSEEITAAVEGFP